MTYEVDRLCELVDDIYCVASNWDTDLGITIRKMIDNFEKQEHGE